MPRKIPMRRCVATGETLPKKELIRIVRTPEGVISVDPTGKANGREGIDTRGLLGEARRSSEITAEMQKRGDVQNP